MEERLQVTILVNHARHRELGTLISSLVVQAPQIVNIGECI